MFTSEPSLAQRIERMIGDTPIVDPHTHIRCDQPNAPDLAALMSYHWVKTELIAVGMPPRRPRPGPPAPTSASAARSPTSNRCGTPSMAWCLFRIFRDLYDFDEPQLTESNYRDLFDKVARHRPGPRLGAGPSSRTARTSGPSSPASATGVPTPSKNPDYFYYMLDAHYLFCPGVATDLEPFFVGRTTKGEYFEALEQRPRRPADDHRAVWSA